MRSTRWVKNILELIRRTSTDLPADVEAAIRRALQREKRGSRAAWVFNTILENVALARKKNVPLCQDTGTLVFHFGVPVGFDTNAFMASTRDAVAEATRKGFLRQNTVDSITGASFETNIAPASPVVCFQQGARKTVDARLVMKGGGSENMGRQYSLPDAELGAGRDLEGVRRCILDTVWRAQGGGCAPGVLGVCIGGDRTTSYNCAKEQFLRKLNDRSEVKVLSRLEQRILKESRTMGVGPMGLWGRTTLLGVKIGTVSRLQASFFLSVSYM